MAATSFLVVFAAFLAFKPDFPVEKKWEFVSEKIKTELDSRKFHIHPGELLELQTNWIIRLRVLDVRSEKDFHTFHLKDAIHIKPEELKNPYWVQRNLLVIEDAVFVIVSNDERDAKKAFQLLAAQSLSNLYILEGGMNRWIEIFLSLKKRWFLRKLLKRQAAAVDLS